MGKEAGRKKLNIFQNTVNSMIAGMAAQLMQKIWGVLTNSCSPDPLLVGIHPYLWFSVAVNQYQVLSLRSGGFMSQKQEIRFVKQKYPSGNLMPNRVHAIAKNWSPEAV